ncbi:hypothetical protein EJ110_NYTH50967 [Nymphaea thermarum]|nr:hypothetical protein EJ110_NYTH50967 [Nymphaea thermarum]
MICTKRLIEMARNWWKMAVRGRNRISFLAVNMLNTRGKATDIAQKGHFVAYASDGQRGELLLSIDGAITFPYDYETDMPRQIENALLVSLSSSR